MEANKRHGVADGWVYRVAINHARRVARRRSMEQRVFESKCQCRPSRSRWRDLEVSRVTVERQRQVVMLRHVAEMSENEIGTVLGISRGTVSSTLHDAHQRLGRLLDDEKEL